MVILLISIAVVAVIVLVVALMGNAPLTCSGSTPNECNNQCWENCTAHHIFQCEASGGMCAADPNDCPPETPNSCNGTCWACAAGQTFICNATIGGTCKS